MGKAKAAVEEKQEPKELKGRPRAEAPAVQEPKRAAVLTNIAVGGGLVPTDLEGMWRLAQIFSKSGLMPKGMDNPEAIFVAIEAGLETGMRPFQACQNIAVINGRPVVWGDAQLALVRASGLLENFSEEPIRDDGGSGKVMGFRCRAKRKGQAAIIEHTFTVEDAKTAGLWGKAGGQGQPTPWVTYPQRMLQMRARSWTHRDGFADVLKGLRQAEEVIDEISEATIIEQPRSRTEALKAKLDERLGKPADAAATALPATPPVAEPIPDDAQCAECKATQADERLVRVGKEILCETCALEAKAQ